MKSGDYLEKEEEEEEDRKKKNSAVIVKNKYKIIFLKYRLLS